MVFRPPIINDTRAWPPQRLPMKGIGRGSRARNRCMGRMVHGDRRLTLRFLIKNRDTVRILEGRV